MNATSGPDRSGFLEVTVDGSVALVTMNRPETLNGLDPAAHAELAGVWAELADDESVRAAVLTGAGRAFSAGGDLKDMAARLTDDPRSGPGITAAMARSIVYNLLDFEKPVVAAVNGAAVGLGATLALLCDVVVASRDAVWGDPHVRIGLVPGDGGLAVWTVLAGPNRAKELMMLGTTISSADADRLGLVNRVVEPEQVVPEALSIARDLAAGPQVAVRGTKMSVNNWIKAQFGTLFEVSLAAELHSMQHPDFPEGVAAAVEKRAPRFE